MGGFNGEFSTQEGNGYMKAVTTFSPQGYIEYGERFLQSYVKHVPFSVLAYVEEPPPFKHSKVEYRDIYDIPDLIHFLEDAKRRQLSQPKNYLYDAAKFSHKVFSQLDAFKAEKGEVFWFDADVVLFEDVSQWELRGYLKDVCLAYLGRDTYTETGFIGFDTRHKDFPMFKHHYEDMYKKRKIFQLDHWTDCHAFDEARRGISGRDLTNGTGMNHVWCESPLAKFSDHCKGKRKDIGASPEHPNFEQIRSINTDSRRKTA